MSFFSSGRLRSSRSTTSLSQMRSKTRLNSTTNQSEVDLGNEPAGQRTSYSSSDSSSSAASVFSSSTTTTCSSTRSVSSFFKFPTTADNKKPEVEINTTPTAWYDQKRLEETVTEFFLVKALGDSENLRKRLGSPLMESGSASSLTDTTFSQWILSKCRKLFMVLYEVGAPERIFDLVESSWDDTDLPIDMADVSKLGFNDTNIEKRFWRRQWAFIAREIEKGTHMAYLDEEIVPIETMRLRKKTPVVVGNSSTNVGGKFIFPRSQLVVTRKSIPLDNVSEAAYMREIQRLKEASHGHLVSIFASYTQSNVGYILFTPSPSLPLRSFIAGPTPAFKLLPQEGKRRQVFDWIHCLSDAVAFLSGKGVTHGDISPRTILLDPSGVIYLTTPPGPYDLENSGSEEYPNYDYLAPEIYRTMLSVRTANKSSPRQRVTVTKTPSSDVFSLSCVFLELLTFVQNKRTVKQFAYHRALRNRRPRGAIADQSFHANLEPVSSWISLLCKASEKDAAFVEACATCSDVLFQPAGTRPDAYAVRDAFLKLVERECGRNVPHCGAEKMEGWRSSSGTLEKELKTIEEFSWYDEELEA